LDRSVSIALAREKRGVAAPTITPSFRTSRCKVKSVGGTVQMTWNHGTTSTASVSGKFHDSKGARADRRIRCNRPDLRGRGNDAAARQLPARSVLGRDQPDHRIARDLYCLAAVARAGGSGGNRSRGR
jgi:hypothetical protein